MSNNLYDPNEEFGESRQKKVVSDAANDLNRSITQDYPQYFNSSPTWSTYYQIDTLASTRDQNLENVTQTIGGNSALRYRKIDMVSLYGADVLDLSTQITEYGPSTEITGDAILLPDTIIPHVGDMFVFDLTTDTDSLKDIVFNVISVNISGVSTKKFYKIEYSLSKANERDILLQVPEDKHFEVRQENVGTSKDSVLLKKDASLIDEAHALIDALSQKYKDLFYDPDTDMFTCIMDGQYLWSPSTQKFMHDCNLGTKYKQIINDDIYCMNLTDREFPGIFSTADYQNSIYSKITKGTPITINCANVSITIGMALNKCQNLPFAFTGINYGMVNIGKTTPISFDCQYDNVNNIKNQKLVDPQAWDTNNQIIPLQYDAITDGTLMYFDHGGFIKESFIYKANKIIRTNLSHRISNNMPWVLATNEPDPNHVIENIIILYASRRLELSRELFQYINDAVYDSDLSTYMFLPIVIMALKKTCDNVQKPRMGVRL